MIFRMSGIMLDMPKLESPFIRDPETHVVTPIINPGYEWVFEDPKTIAVEKIDGTNVSIYIEKGELIAIRNRTNIINCDVLENNRFLTGLRNARKKDWIPVATGQYFGELMGPKIQRNFLDLEEPLWYPFDYLKQSAYYKSFHKYEKTFENWSNWFQNDLFSLLYRQKTGAIKQPEGIVFCNPDGRMAKLRLDMFEWWKGQRHKE